MTAALVAGLLAGYGIAVPVGAVAAYLVALTARTSLRIGAAAALGVATADGLYALVAAFGGAALTPLLRPVVVPLRWGSALVLLALAVRGAVAAVGRYRGRGPAAALDGTPGGPARAYLGLLGMTAMNPATVVYFAALVLGTRTSGAPPDRLEQTVFIVAAFAASASWQLLLAGGGALLGRVLTGSRGRLVTAVVSSAVIAVLGLRLLLWPQS
ncbi:LysE family transporter [Streptacidiphilus griseoplanus]|uniref:LysE family transporter n=1 Tax=Peterkaempfera griseoplana TaxID=66896 RepID=UPI0006E16F7D|nr:LysE family transporter [Peterkaempfera griseoplana]